MNYRSANKVSKSKILKSALTLFSSTGYSETRMSEIARGVGISVGALYLRFKNKEELCLELIKNQTKDFEGLAGGILNLHKDPLKALKAYIALNLDYAFKRKQLISIFIREQRLPFLQPLRKRFFKSQHIIIEDILIKGIKKNAFKPMDCRDTASVIFASIRGMIMLKLVFGIGNAKSLSNSLFKLLANGIRKDKP